MRNPSAQDDDHTLIAQVAEASTGALSELYDRYNRLVFSVVLAMVGDPATAEEITLDAFVLVWQRAATYRPDRGKVSTWLVAIARNHAIDFLRRHGRRPESKSVPWDNQLPQSAPPTRAMEDSVEQSIRRQRIREAVSRLPDDQRQALGLAFFGGLTHEEIAARLDQPLGTVKTRIRLAMGKLRDILQDDRPLPDTSE